MKKLICPICGKEVDNLISHIRVHKPNIHDKKSFYAEFPNYKGALHIDNRKTQNCECEYCGKVYKFANGLSVHIKKQHPQYYRKVDNRTCAKLVCPICGKNKSDIKQHINRYHSMDWEDFCNQYNWDVKNTKYISEEYKKHLSINKIKFYNETQRGFELKQKQSELWTKNNPTKDKNITSKSICNRTLNSNIPKINGRGITIQYKGNTFRSWNEFVFYQTCIRFNIEIEYEPNQFVVHYFNEEKGFNTIYLPYFYIPKIGIIELKESKITKFKSLKEQKYIKVKDIYTKDNKDFDVYYPKELYSLLDIKLRDFEIKDYAISLLKNANKSSLHIWCADNSAIMKSIFGNDLSIFDFITITKYIQNEI